MFSYGFPMVLFNSSSISVMLMETSLKPVSSHNSRRSWPAREAGAATHQEPEAPSCFGSAEAKKTMGKFMGTMGFEWSWWGFEWKTDVKDTLDMSGDCNSFMRFHHISKSMGTRGTPTNTPFLATECAFHGNTTENSTRRYQISLALLVGSLTQQGLADFRSWTWRFNLQTWYPAPLVNIQKNMEKSNNFSTYVQQLC